MDPWGLFGAVVSEEGNKKKIQLLELEPGTIGLVDREPNHPANQVQHLPASETITNHAHLVMTQVTETEIISPFGGL